MTAIMFPNTDVQDLPPPLRLMRLVEVAAEIEAIDAALPPADPSAPNGKEYLPDIVSGLLAGIPGAARDLPAHWLQALPGTGARTAAVLRWQIDGVVRAMMRHQELKGSEFPATWQMLLPDRSRARMTMLLADGWVPLTWVQKLRAKGGTGAQRGRPGPYPPVTDRW